MLLPALSRAKEMAVRIKCMNNVKQLDLALHIYGGDNRDKLPRSPGGSWSWDIAWDVGDLLVQNGCVWKGLYCPASGFTDNQNWIEWTLVTNVYRNCGYPMAMSGENGVNPTNQNQTLTATSMVDPITGLSIPAPPITDRVLVADATISNPGQDNEVNRSANTYTDVIGSLLIPPHRTYHMRGAMPVGGNLGMLDGHVQWRKFESMHVRTVKGYSGPVFWW
jgi:prepilin-type processing-associated H-X9-DG protein